MTCRKEQIPTGQVSGKFWEKPHFMEFPEQNAYAFRFGVEIKCNSLLHKFGIGEIATIMHPYQSDAGLYAKLIAMIIIRGIRLAHAKIIIRESILFVMSCSIFDQSVLSRITCAFRDKSKRIFSFFSAMRTQMDKRTLNLAACYTFSVRLSQRTQSR